MSSSTGRILVRQVKRERNYVKYVRHEGDPRRHPSGNVPMLEADIIRYIPRAEGVTMGFVQNTANSRTKTRRNLAVVKGFMRDLLGEGRGKEFE